MRGMVGMGGKLDDEIGGERSPDTYSHRYVA